MQIVGSLYTSITLMFAEVTTKLQRKIYAKTNLDFEKRTTKRIS